MEPFRVKQEITEPPLINTNSEPSKRNSLSSPPLIDLDSSDNDSSTSGNRFSNSKKARVSNDEKRKKSGDDVVLPAGFLDPLPPKEAAPVPRVANEAVAPSCRNFWKAGDFDEVLDGDWDTASDGMDHVRVHPRFLHSNATSHKWVLGAFAELLDNSLDEFCNGATYVNIDMLRNKKDGNRMLLIEDNGGGMDPDKMRQCMSLGYSLKSKVADTIGQYGNGFKTSSMRLGADVIVFSRCSAKDGKRSTQSIGLLSYTFLRSTGKEDIVVPMLDYVKDGGEWKKIIRSSPGDWNMNAEAVVQWSPFSSEVDLLKQFDHMKGQGTRIIIYNLWEDDQGQLELDFDADEEVSLSLLSKMPFSSLRFGQFCDFRPKDIQIRGVNRDERNIHMANKYPNSRHFLTYRHSLRAYASILYLRIPPGFRMILRGKDIQHHNIVNDMMMTTEITYRPQPGADKVPKDSSIVAVVTMGFVKDAKAHIDVQGYNVYHKNRLIKPFWRLWNSTGSDGRGVIGVLEANFVEPAHDKQGFERTIVLSRLETRLLQMQKTYWRTYCHKIGYAPRISKSSMEEFKEDEYMHETSSKRKKAASKPPDSSFSNKSSANKHQKLGSGNGFGENGNNLRGIYEEGPSSPKFTPLNENIHDDDSSHKEKSANKFTPKDFSHSARYAQHPANSEAGQDYSYSPYGKSMQIVTHTQSRFQSVVENGSTPDLYQLVEENRRLKEQLERKDEDILAELLGDLERERNRRKALEAQVEEAKEKSEHLSKEQEIAIDTFAEEREMREMEQDALRKKLEEATAAIQELVQRVKQLDLEKIKSHKWSGSKYMS